MNLNYTYTVDRQTKFLSHATHRKCILNRSEQKKVSEIYKLVTWTKWKKSDYTIFLHATALIDILHFLIHFFFNETISGIDQIHINIINKSIETLF